MLASSGPAGDFLFVCATIRRRGCFCPAPQASALLWRTARAFCGLGFSHVAHVKTPSLEVSSCNSARLDRRHLCRRACVRIWPFRWRLCAAAQQAVWLRCRPCRCPCFADQDRRGVFRCFQIGEISSYQWFRRQPRGQTRPSREVRRRLQKQRSTWAMASCFADVCRNSCVARPSPLDAPLTSRQYRRTSSVWG